MRKFINAAEGYNDKSRERWEQARMIAWYSAFDRKPMKLTDISIPGEGKQKQISKKAHQNKEEAYEILKKWSK